MCSKLNRKGRFGGQVTRPRCLVALSVLVVLSVLPGTSTADNSPVGTWKGRWHSGGASGAIRMVLKRNNSLTGSFTQALEPYGGSGSVTLSISGDYSYNTTSGLLTFSCKGKTTVQGYPVKGILRGSGDGDCDSASGGYKGTYKIYIRGRWRILDYVNGTWNLHRTSRPFRAKRPRPRDGAKGQSVNTTFLRWSNGGGACSYKVYFGRTNPPAFIGTRDTTTYDPPGQLKYFKRYYWRIDSRNTNGTTKGVVWSFKTEPNPLIGTNKSSIDFGNTSVSENFRAFNDGTGTLNYTVSISEGGDYFHVSPDSGRSTGSSDKKKFTVTVDRSVILPRQTVTGKVKLESSRAFNSPQYIDLSATETISGHVFSIDISQGLDYGEANEPTYQFYFAAETDGTVNSVEVNTPAGHVFTIPRLANTQSGNVATWHAVVDGRDHWEYEADFNDQTGLASYSDGAYEVKVYYRNDSADQTVLTFGEPNTPTPIPQPIERPILTFPPHNSSTASPVIFTWEDCEDTNAASIWLALQKETTGSEKDADFATNVNNSNPIALGRGLWHAGLFFDHSYEFDNIDGIGVVVGKYSTSNYRFKVALKKPNTPTGVAASDGTYPDKVRVTWNAASGATHYRVYRSRTISGDKKPVSTWRTKLAYNDKSAVKGREYFYWVKAKNVTGTSRFSSYDLGWRK